MKISELLKKIGIDLDSEIDDDTEKDITMNKDGNKKESNVDNNLADAKLNNDKEETKMAFKAPKVDKNGFYDLSAIEDADMKEFFKARNIERKAELDARKTEDDKKVVTDAISKYASGLKFAEGWTLDDALKLGDFSKVVNDENINKEIENAFTNLKTAKANMFVADKETSKSSPIMEGFNPQNGNANNGCVPNSFMEAFSMME